MRLVVRVYDLGKSLIEEVCHEVPSTIQKSECRRLASADRENAIGSACVWGLFSADSVVKAEYIVTEGDDVYDAFILSELTRHFPLEEKVTVMHVRIPVWIERQIPTWYDRRPWIESAFLEKLERERTNS